MPDPRPLLLVGVALAALAACSATSGPAPEELPPEPPPPTRGADPVPDEPSDTTTGGVASANPSDGPEDEVEAEDVLFELKVDADTVSPAGDRFTMQRGEPATIRVDSDRSGELHVHSLPEQTIAFESGQSTLRLTIDRPGLIEVEDHETGVVIAQLEVR